MSNHSKIDTTDTINNGLVTKSNITGTTVGDKRALDVVVLDNSGANSNRLQKIFNIPITAADTEQSLVLPVDVTGYLIKTRGGGTLKLTHVSGESGTKYVELGPRSAYNNNNSFSNLTLYFQSPLLGEIVEIVTWE